MTKQIALIACVLAFGTSASAVEGAGPWGFLVDCKVNHTACHFISESNLDQNDDYDPEGRQSMMCVPTAWTDVIQMLHAWGFVFAGRQIRAESPDLPYFLANAMGTTTQGSSVTNVLPVIQGWGQSVAATTQIEGAAYASPVTPSSLIRHIASAEPGVFGVGHYHPLNKNLISGSFLSAYTRQGGHDIALNGFNGWYTPAAAQHANLADVAAATTFMVHDPENIISQMSLIPVSSLGARLGANQSQDFVMIAPQYPLSNQMLRVLEYYMYWQPE